VSACGRLRPYENGAGWAASRQACAPAFHAPTKHLVARASCWRFPWTLRWAAEGRPSFIFSVLVGRYVAESLVIWEAGEDLRGVVGISAAIPKFEGARDIAGRD